MSTLSGTNASSTLICSSDVIRETTFPGDHLNSVAGITDAQDSPSTRKRLPWSMEEDRLLVKLREEQKLAWSEVIKQFTREFSGGLKGPYKFTRAQHSRKNWHLCPFMLIDMMNSYAVVSRERP